MDEKSQWWIENLKERDESAITELAGLLRSFILSRGLFVDIGHITVNDVVQETIMDIFDGLYTFAGRSSFYTWACACAKTRCAAAWRSLKTNQQKKYEAILKMLMELEQMEHPQAKKELEIAVLQVVRQLLDTGRLSETDWEIYKMYQIYDYPVDEVAAEFEITANNVYVKAHRVNEKIKLAVNYE